MHPINHGLCRGGIDQHGRNQTGIERCFVTSRIAESWWAYTGPAIDSSDTRATILTGSGRTLVDIGLTLSSGISGQADTAKRAGAGHTRACILTGIAAACRLFTKCTEKHRGTLTGEGGKGIHTSTAILAGLRGAFIAVTGPDDRTIVIDDGGIENTGRIQTQGTRNVLARIDIIIIV